MIADDGYVLFPNATLSNITGQSTNPTTLFFYSIAPADTVNDTLGDIFKNFPNGTYEFSVYVTLNSSMNIVCYSSQIGGNALITPKTMVVTVNSGTYTVSGEQYYPKFSIYDYSGSANSVRLYPVSIRKTG